MNVIPAIHIVAALAVAAPAAGQVSPTWTLEATPVVTIGGSDERPDYLLERLADATRLSDGRIVIADGGASEVRYYDADGTYLLTAIREGQGPGEVQGIIDILRMAGDSLAVLSYRPGITILDPQGRYVRTTSANLWGITDQCRLAEGGISLLTSADLLAVADQNLGIAGCPPRPNGVHRGDALVSRYQVDSQRTDSIAILPGTERNGIHYRIFGALLLVVPGHDRVFMGDTRSGSIHVRDFDGRPLDEFVMPFEARPTPQQARIQTTRRWERPDGSVQVSDAYEYPNQLPRAARLLSDVSGGVWVAEFPEPTEALNPIFLEKLYIPRGLDSGLRWLLLNASGSPTAAMATPARHYPIEVGLDYVLGVSWDALEVQQIEIRTLGRPAS